MDQNNNLNPQAPIVQDSRAESSVGIKNLRIILVAVVAVVIILAGLLLISSGVFNKQKTYLLTKKDLDSTVHIKKNDVVSIDTRTIPGLELNTEMTNPKVVEGSEGYDNKTGNFKGKFIGKSKGETELIISGTPPCTKGEVCLPIEVIIYKTKIVVN